MNTGMMLAVMVTFIACWTVGMKTLLRFVEMRYDHELDMQRMRLDHELEMPPPMTPTAIHVHVDGNVNEEQVLRLAVTTVTHMLTTRNN